MSTTRISRPETNEIETRTIRKISWRLLPLVVIAYLVAYIDRANIAFASLTMNKDIGLSAYAYGWGAGIFFVGYFLFEVPSNVILHKFGARKWIARIMFSWGVVSGLMALITGPTSFLTVRFLLGVAEAGFFPGMVLYLTYWFPARYRARVIATLFLAAPISNAAASFLSGVILSTMEGTLGLKGWQWVFVLEALPAIVLASLVLKLLTDHPSVADWLAPDERQWLVSELDKEQRAIQDLHPKMMLWNALLNRRVLALCAMYLATLAAGYGLTFFLPQIVKQLGQSTFQTGVLSSIPFFFGIIGLLAWGFSSDKRRERRWHTIAGCLLAAIGLAGAGWFAASYWAIFFLSIATMGNYGSRPAFWPMASTFLTGASAAGAIALINSIGNLGGFIGPLIVGWAKETTNSFGAGLYALAGSILLGAVITFFAAPQERA